MLFCGPALTESVDSVPCLSPRLSLPQHPYDFFVCFFVVVVAECEKKCLNGLSFLHSRKEVDYDFFFVVVSITMFPSTPSAFQFFPPIFGLWALPPHNLKTSHWYGVI